MLREIAKAKVLPGDRSVSELPAFRWVREDLPVHWRYRTRHPQYTRMEWSNNMLFVDWKERRGRALLRNSGTGQPHLKRLWRRGVALSPAWVLDVGLNYGEFVFLTDYDRHTRVIGIEANRDLEQFVRRSWALHPDSARIEVLFALASDTASASTAFYVDHSCTGRSSAVPAYREGPQIETREVPSIVLDEVLGDRLKAEHDVFFKIDVEGFEPQVMRGLDRTLADAAHCYGFIEFSGPAFDSIGVDPQAFVAWLDARFESAFAVTRDGRLLYLDELSVQHLYARVSERPFQTDLLLFTDAEIRASFGLQRADSHVDALEVPAPPKRSDSPGLLRAAARHPLARIFTQDKVVRSRPLNAMGLQVARTLSARALYHFRSTHTPHGVQDAVDALRTDGMAMWPDFLPDDQFQALRDECRALLDDPSVEGRNHHHHGPNSVIHLDLVRAGMHQATHARRYLMDPRLGALFQAGERRPVDMLGGTRLVERLIQGPLHGLEDQETELHLDTFFHTHKAWLYLTDVELEDGPLVYVRGSHLLNRERLYHDYRDSLHPDRGSRRAAPTELEHLEQTVLTCPANTLVLADTCGFHRRLRGVPGRVREAVLVSVRHNPFVW